MELRQLGYFVAVAEERNFTRAAARIPIAQPAISQQIRRLEAELGEHLFHRARRGITLTPAGQALLPHAPAALQAAGGGRRGGGAVLRPAPGRLGRRLVPPPARPALPPPARRLPPRPPADRADRARRPDRRPARRARRRAAPRRPDRPRPLRPPAPRR